MAGSSQPGRGRRFFLFLVALLLLPLLYALARALVDVLPALFIGHPPWIAPEAIFLFAGFFAWIVLSMVLPPAVRVYVFGHELTHAVWGVLTGSKIGRMRIGDDGGFVELSNPGLFTTLAPYFVPFYLVVLLLLRLLLGLFLDMAPYSLWWLFAMGLAYGFHILYTLKSLAQKQPDIRVYGHLVSYMVILLANILLFGYGFVAVTSATLPEYHHAIFRRSCESYTAVWRKTSASSRKAFRWAQAKTGFVHCNPR